MQILDHNLKAYKALIKSFKKANRACIVHPTGLGKSYIAYQLIADNPDSTFLVLTSLKKIEEKWREELREEGVCGLSENYYYYSRSFTLTHSCGVITQIFSNNDI